MHLKQSLALVGAVVLTLTAAGCGSGSSSSSSGGSSSGSYGDCKVTSKAGSISLKPVKSGTLTVETTLPAQGWWNGTTPESIKSGYEYCFAANLAHAAELNSVTVKNVSFDQLVAGHTNNFDLALAEISITPERAKVVDFSVPYFDSNIGVLTKKSSGVSESNIKSKKCAAYSGTTSVPFLQNELKCATIEDLPGLPDALPGCAVRPGRRRLPRHRDRARRGQGDRRRSTVVGPVQDR